MHPLKTVNLTKIYARRGQIIEGIADVTLTVSAGEVLSLLGPNGAGKTTFIKMLCSQVTPDEGEVIIDGLPILKKPKGFLSVRRSIGYAPETPFFYSNLTGWEFARFLESVYGFSLEQGNLLSFVNVANRLHLTPQLGKLVGTYSKGTLRKLILSFAIAFGRRLIILDEPSNGLDPDSYLILRELLLECKGANRAILLSTHQLTMAQDVADTIVVFVQGRMRCLAKNTASVEDFYKSAVADSEVL